MTNKTLANFVESLHEDIVEAMGDADMGSVDPQYRLGIRRLAKSFFDTFELFEVRAVLPTLEERDVDAWFAGTEQRESRRQD